jgi:hypothetical protein
MATEPQVDESYAGLPLDPQVSPANDDSGLRLSALRKRLIRRASPDRSQAPRRTFQFVFLLLNVWLGGAFYLWVRHIETGTTEPWYGLPESRDGSPSPA